MATKSIAWNSGSGNITVTYSGSRDDTVSVSSSENDIYEDREQVITVKTTDNAISRQVTVRQGMREPNLITKDGHWIVTKNDKYVIVKES